MDAADIEIMTYAAKYDYVVLTHDLDFSAILAATQGAKPSVVQIRSDNLSLAVIGDSLLGGRERNRIDPRHGRRPETRRRDERANSQNRRARRRATLD